MDEQVIGLGTVSCWGVLLLLSFILTLMYVAAEGRALTACGPRQRTLEPGLVWLNVVPVFHLFWKFWTAAQIAASLGREFDSRGLRTNFNFGRAAGALVPVVALVARFVFWVGQFLARRAGEEVEMLLLGSLILLGVVELVAMIAHWNQLNGFVKQLNESRPAGDDLGGFDEEGGRREFDEDYRPIPRRRRERAAE